MGCGSAPSVPWAEAARRPAVDVVVVDERPSELDQAADGFDLALCWVPLVPYVRYESAHVLDRSFTPALLYTMESTGVFEAVYGSGDPEALRAEAPWEARVRLEHTSVRYTYTSYLLGFLGVIPHVLGAPNTYTCVELRGELVVGPRGGVPAVVRRIEEVEVGAVWLYGGLRRADALVEEAVCGWVLEALAELR